MKQNIYDMEEQFLSKYAIKSKDTKGRKHKIEECEIRTDFQRDRDRIIHCKAFRRLKHKTQVFLSPEGDHYRTRLTHTLEVSQIARTIARGLRLNEDLVEAICLGHDLGHTPFGHVGEQTLSKVSGKPFYHNEQSLRVVEFLENDGVGLNLTYEVKDGILNHKLSGKPETLEGKVVSYADRIAYINHDIDDGIRAGILKEEDLPDKAIELFGVGKGNRINSLVLDLIENNLGKNQVVMSKDFEETLLDLRQFMFDKLYIDTDAKIEEKKAIKLLEFLYYYFTKNINQMPEFYQKIAQIDGADTAVCDYIAGMTDRYAVKIFNEIFVPKNWHKF